MRSHPQVLTGVARSAGEGIVHTQSLIDPGAGYIEIPELFVQTPVPLAVTVPDQMPPRQIEGVEATWTTQALAIFEAARVEALRNNPDFTRNLPFASLRSLIELAFDEIAS